MEKMTSMLRLRMSAKDAHYGGNLVIEEDIPEEDSAPLD